MRNCDSAKLATSFIREPKPRQIKLQSNQALSGMNQTWPKGSQKPCGHKLSLAAPARQPTVLGMKCLVVALLCLTGCSPFALAQLSAELVLPQDKFLPAEEFRAGVRIVNRSGQTLVMGEESDWITFALETSTGESVPQLSEPPVQKPFTLESSKQATLKVDLAPCYDLRKPGGYQIRATVKIKNWSGALVTKNVPFEIIEGTKLWEQTFGLPSSGQGDPPTVRKYTLQQANYLKEPRLYLRISDANSTVLKVINVGPILSIGRPEPMLDKNNRLHLLHQTGARSSLYLVFNPTGDMEVRQTYEYAGSRPRLQWSDKGEIEVKGGSRQLNPNDLPPESEQISNVETNKTN